jgi:hypothetical protein
MSRRLPSRCAAKGLTVFRAGEVLWCGQQTYESREAAQRAAAEALKCFPALVEGEAWWAE